MECSLISGIATESLAVFAVIDRASVVIIVLDQVLDVYVLVLAAPALGADGLALDTARMVSAGPD